MTQTPESRELVVVGFGPAGLATTIAASEYEKDVTVIDPAPQPGAGNLADFSITSNSAGNDFVDPLRKHSDYQDFTSLDSAASLSNNPEPVPLPTAARFLQHVANRIVDKSLAELFRTNVIAITPEDDGTYLITTDDGTIFKAPEVIVATGAAERHLPELAGRDPDKTFLSSQILGETLPDDFTASLEESDGQVVIVGGAHSAYSAAGVVLDTFPDAHITFMKRKPTRPFFRSLAEALRLGYKPVAGDCICPESGKINRFSGVRGPARNLWRVEQQGNNPRISSVIGTDVATINPEVTVIQATGYQPNKPRLHVPGYEEIAYGLGGTAHGLGSFVINNVTLPNINGIGLGFGGNNDGFNTYYNQAVQHFAERN